MRSIVCNTYEEMSAKAAEFVRSQITLNPSCVLGLATGSTPIGMYKAIAGMGLDFSNVTTFNLDEYYPISRSNPQSYHYFMSEHLYAKVNLKPENIFIPNGETHDAAQECKQYETAIAARGGIDLQILGIGQNGHIGFNEPDDALIAPTHLTGLTQSTIDANARFFESREQVPEQAITMGVATIMRARKILLLANGRQKAQVIKALMENKVSTKVPATVLCMHPDVVLICDKEAWSEM